MHLKSFFSEKELDQSATCKEFLQVRTEGNRTVSRSQLHYNLDAIISLGYRVKYSRATQFRIWATQRLKDYLIQGYSINKNHLAQKEREVQILKDGIHILSRNAGRVIDENMANNEWLTTFSRGLTLFLQHNRMLFDKEQMPLINSDTLASLTLVIASSKPEEMETVKRLVISVLTRNRKHRIRTD